MGESDCNDKSCKIEHESRFNSLEKNVEGQHITLYGEDGRGGVVGEQKAKVDKIQYWKIISTFGAGIVIAGYILVSNISNCASQQEFIAHEKSQVECDKKTIKNIAETTKNIALITQQLETLTGLSIQAATDRKESRKDREESRKEQQQWNRDTEKRLMLVEERIR